MILSTWLRVHANVSKALFAKSQSFIILLNRQRVERTQSSHHDNSPSSAITAQAPRAWANVGGPKPYGVPEQHTGRAPQRGRSLVINSSISLLQAFLFFYHRNKAVLICWTMGQQAFNACMILILDAWETGNEVNEKWCNSAYGVFVELYNKGVHKLAELAVQRISYGLMLLANRRMEREQSDAMSSRRPSGAQQLPFQSPLELDTASMTDFSGDAVMGNTGMFLLEDPGLQFYSPQVANFRPFEWVMPTSAHPSDPSCPPTPDIPSPTIPVSQITAAPFPVMSPLTNPVTNSPFAVGLQPRMPSSQRRMASGRAGYAPQQVPQNQTAFTPINVTYSPQQMQAPQTYSQLRGPRQSYASGSNSSNNSGSGSRSSPRLDKPLRSHQRRK